MLYKKDTNHNLIANLFRQYGYIVIDTSWSRGKLLDFIAYKLHGELWFIEVKNGNKKLTEDECCFIGKHKEKSILLNSIDATKKFLNYVNKIKEMKNDIKT